MAGEAAYGDRPVWDRLEGVPDPAEHTLLVGHRAAADRVAGQYSAGHLHHAWLIAGPRGIGKATLAFRLAAQIMRYRDPAAAPPTLETPEELDAVASRIARGGHPNVLHVSRPWDEKTKRFRAALTVDEVRAAGGFFATTAGEPGWRVCIIDAADDMNRAAANALLKTLEEPPANTVFFVLAHSPGRLPVTVRSRCLPLTLRPLADEPVLEVLRELGIAGELGEEGRSELLRLAAGSVRRAIVLANEGGLDLAHRLIDLARQGGPDWPAIHRLADELAARGRDDRYRLFLDLAFEHMSAQLEHDEKMAGGEQRHISRLVRWAQLWEKTRRSASLAESYNLDRKQVILSLFRAMATIG